MTDLFCAVCGLLQTRVGAYYDLKACGCGGKMFVTLPLGSVPVGTVVMPRSELTAKDHRFLKSIRIAWSADEVKADAL